jgi:hypothetical protein
MPASIQPWIIYGQLLTRYSIFVGILLTVPPPGLPPATRRPTPPHPPLLGVQTQLLDEGSRVVVQLAGAVRRGQSATVGRDDVQGAVLGEARTRRDQAPDDDVLLQANQLVALAAHRRLGQNAGRLLEGRRRQERFGRRLASVIPSRTTLPFLHGPKRGFTEEVKKAVRQGTVNPLA